MSLTQKDEQELNELFRTQEVLLTTNDLYYKNRETITNKLIAKLKPEMEKAQKSWSRKYNLDLAECESLIYESLLTAIDTFKISKGNCKFTSFFWTVTSQIFKNYLSKIYAQKRMPRVAQNNNLFSSVCSLSFPIDPTAEDEDSTLDDVLTEGDTAEQKFHHKLILQQIYKDATPKQKRVLKRLFLGKSYSEVGTALHMSASDVCNLVKQLRLKYERLANEI